jgi:lauroyl/myristoyl acyltransferase
MLASLATGTRRYVETRAAIGKAFQDSDKPGPKEIAAEVVANQYELRLQVLRCYRPAGWRPSIVVTGREHLERAMEGGRGAVLWVSHFVFHGLVFEMGMKDCGYELIHVSRLEHGFSKTKYGMAVLNPVRTFIENKYLGKRIILNDKSRLEFARDVLGYLRANELVSMTVGAWEGKQVMTVPLFGHRYQVATGAVTAAARAGAPLLPVFPVWEHEERCFRVAMEPPLPVAGHAVKSEMLESASKAYAGLLEPYIWKYPGQWRGWRYVR